VLAESADHGRGLTVKSRFVVLLCLVVFATIGAAGGDLSASRYFYAVNQSITDRGSISVYDIDHHHRLVKTIRTVQNVADVKGVAVSAVTGRLYVAYRTPSNEGMIYCLNVYDDQVLWNRGIRPDVDRLSISPDGRLLYVPTWEGNTFDYINVLDASTGDVARQVHFSNASHDALFPLSGPLFQETKAQDGSGRYLYLIDPASYAISRIGPYAGILGPYAVDGRSTYVANNVTDLWGMQIAAIKNGRIITASIPDHPSGEAGLAHGIAWRPDEREVWQSGGADDPHVYVWNMSNPMDPILKQRLNLRSGHGSHWLTFDIDGDYGYVAPNKNSEEATEIFDARTHVSVGTIRSSEDMLEIQFSRGKISRVGDQYGIGRVPRRAR
jgi:outer membrane protein assembly factor BamB